MGFAKTADLYAARPVDTVAALTALGTFLVRGVDLEDDTEDAEDGTDHAADLVLLLLALLAEPISQERVEDDGIVQWETDFTGTLDTAQQDIARHRIGGVIRGWLNEWGALRGRNPYGSGFADALVRAIIDTGDDTGGSTDCAVEIVDRTGTPFTSWGRRWQDGALIRNEILMNDVIVLDNAESVPADLPAGTVIVRLEA